MSGPRPLPGLVVVEIGHSVAAPYAGIILGELGAEVIKVKPQRRRSSARLGVHPLPWVLQARSRLRPRQFRHRRRPRRPCRGRTVAPADPGPANILIHNLKFGTLERYGLGAAALLAEAEPLYCNIGAFGRVGPLRERPGYNPMMQAYGGLMSLLGEEGRRPVRVTVSIIDIATAMWAAIGTRQSSPNAEKPARAGSSTRRSTKRQWPG